MEKLQVGLVIPQGITPPCVILPAIFQTPDLEPDPVEWLQSSPEEKKLTAEKKAQAEKIAVKACEECPLLHQCRNHFDNIDVYGVIGGATKSEREHSDTSRVCYDPIEHYRNSGEMLTVYEYVDSLTQGKKDKISAILSEINLTVKQLKDVMKVNSVVRPSFNPEDRDVLVKKLLKGGIPERLIVDRAGVTPHRVRSLKHEPLWGREKKIENYFEKEHGTKIFRLSRATKIVYDQLTLHRREGGRNACRCTHGYLTREEIFTAVEPHLTKQDKLRSAQKKRKFKTEEAKLVSGSRRAVNHALSLGVQNGLISVSDRKPCKGEGCTHNPAGGVTGGSAEVCGEVKMFRMKRGVSKKWFTYRYKKLHKPEKEK